jgi:hypothetical protein
MHVSGNFISSGWQNASSGKHPAVHQTSKKTVSRSPCGLMSNLNSPSGSGTAMSVACRDGSPIERSTRVGGVDGAGGVEGFLGCADW